MRLLILLLTIFVLSYSQITLAGFAEVKCLSARETAEELLNIEASGRQHSESTCMEQDHFPRYKLGHRSSGGGDAPDKRPAVILSGKQPYEIKSVKKDADGNYLVKFEYKTEDGKSIKDEFEFVEYSSGKLKSYFGCAAITSAPKTLAIHRACLPK